MPNIAPLRHHGLVVTYQAEVRESQSCLLLMPGPFRIPRRVLLRSLGTVALSQLLSRLVGVDDSCPMGRIHGSLITIRKNRALVTWRACELVKGGLGTIRWAP